MEKFRIPIICAVLLGLFVAWYYVRHPLAPKVVLGGKQFLVELAISPEEKQRGLGYRSALAADRGMLFVYDHPEQYAFWMKGMQFPLDIIWIAGTTIVDISYDTPVATQGALPTYTPAKPVDKVLEINAGIAKKLGVNAGDSIQILKR